MIGYYNYTVVLTYMGTLFGFAGIIYTWKGSIKMALICLMFAGICDMFDGKIASTMQRSRQEKRFGIQIDSLSDLICFGLLPALIVLQYMDGTLIHILVSAVYVLCALIRLAWFNVDEEERQDSEEKGRESYLGLPVTTTSLLIPLFMGGIHTLRLPIEKLCPLLLMGIAVAFISPFHLKKPGIIGKMAMILFGAAGLLLVLMGGMT